MERFNSDKVNGKTRESLVATRVEILGELSEEKRRTIISSRAEALKVVPELDAADQQVQERILPKVPQNARQAFLKTWDHVRKPPASTDRSELSFPLMYGTGEGPSHLGCRPLRGRLVSLAYSAPLRSNSPASREGNLAVIAARADTKTCLDSKV